MTLRLMLCALILLALGGCQNPSRIQAASSGSVGAKSPGFPHPWGKECLPLRTHEAVASGKDGSKRPTDLAGAMRAV